MTLNMKTGEVLKRFIRTPSDEWSGGPNFPGNFSRFDEHLLLRDSSSTVYIVSMDDLLRNSAPYEIRKYTDIYTNEEEKETGR